MRKISFDSGKGYRLYMSESELSQYLACAKQTPQRADLRDKISISCLLAARGGLRVSEISKIKCENRFTDERGLCLRVPEGKSKYRETMIPPELQWADFDKFTYGTSRATFSRWIKRVNEIYYEKTGDSDIHHCTYHDLRRNFIHRLVILGLNIKYIQTLSGHKSDTVFYKHYVDIHSAEFGGNQRELVPWLNSD
tara:strand:+ start:942 stop:1526 length:585 start_codon:yes stop_codon:yes gene_type:complete